LNRTSGVVRPTDSVRLRLRAVRFFEAVDRSNVRVIERGEQLRFAREALIGDVDREAPAVQRDRPFFR